MSASKKLSTEPAPAAERLAEKIPDEDLRHLAGHRPGETAAVIIELELPYRKIDFGRAGGGGHRPALPRRAAAESAEEGDEVERTTAEALSFLRELLDEEPTHLRSARAFVANVRGEHLEAIAGQPWSRRIRLNRRLR